MFVTRRGSGVRVDHGGEGYEGQDGVRSVASILAGVQVGRSGRRGLGTAVVWPKQLFISLGCRDRCQARSSHRFHQSLAGAMYSATHQMH